MVHRPGLACAPNPDPNPNPNPNVNPNPASPTRTLQGLDPDGVDLMLEEWRRESRAHPSLLGTRSTATQQLRHLTPPALPPRVVEGIRHAAASLFARLGLTDYAQFSGWVLPDAAFDAQTERGGLMMAKIAALSADRAAMEASEAGQALRRDDEARRKVRPFSQLAEMDASSTPPLVDYVVPPEVLVARGFDEAAEVTYGTFNDIPLDETTRLDTIKALQEARRGDGRDPDRPIPGHTAPEPIPPPEITELPHPEGSSPLDLCRRSGFTVIFTGVDAVPDLEACGGGVLQQQTAAVGLGLPDLWRRLVGAPAMRQGLPPPEPLPQEAETEAVPAQLPGEGSGGAVAGVGVDARAWGLPHGVQLACARLQHPSMS